MIHLVVALRAEARPLADAFGMKPVSATSPFTIYASDDAQLVVSGVGRVSAGAASAYLHAWNGGARGIWLNVGVAAHRELALGTAVIAQKIIDRSTGRSWYPQILVELPVPTAEICTVDQAISEPAGDLVYEMEAAGFFQTVLGWTTAELAGCWKIVSDHGVGESEWLTRQEVEAMVAEQSDRVAGYARSMRALLDRLPKWKRSAGAESLLGRWHFTVTHERLLDNLDRRAAALECDLEVVDLGACGSARQVLARLQAELDRIATARSGP